MVLIVARESSPLELRELERLLMLHFCEAIVIDTLDAAAAIRLQVTLVPGSR